VGGEATDILGQPQKHPSGVCKGEDRVKELRYSLTAEASDAVLHK